MTMGVVAYIGESGEATIHALPLTMLTTLRAVDPTSRARVDRPQPT
jgi:hypothetical protein